MTEPIEEDLIREFTAMTQAAQQALIRASRQSGRIRSRSTPAAVSARIPTQHRRRATLAAKWAVANFRRDRNPDAARTADTEVRKEGFPVPDPNTADQKALAQQAREANARAAESEQRAAAAEQRAKDTKADYDPNFDTSLSVAGKAVATLALAYAAAEAEQHFAPDPETELSVDQAAAMDATAPDTDYGFVANQEPPVDIYDVPPDFDGAGAVSNAPQSEIVGLAHPREIGELLNAEPSTGPDSGGEPVTVPEIDRGAEVEM